MRFYRIAERFIHFGSAGLNNAYLMSVGLYHQHFHLFEAVFKLKGNSIHDLITFFRELAKENDDILNTTKNWLKLQSQKTG